MEEDTITFANVGCDKIILSNEEINTFKTIAIKKNGPLIIYDKRWYFRLVKAKEGDYGRARALMDDFTLDNLTKCLVVCFTPAFLPGSTKPFITKSGDAVRIYSVFKSYIEYYQYMLNFKPEERAFYEIIFGRLPQKPHFDIDINEKDILVNWPHENIDNLAEHIRETLIEACINVLTELKVEVDISRDILIYSSHGEHKRSFHLVINNKYHDGNHEAKAFYDEVMVKFSSITNSNLCKFVDRAVYSPTQQFRIVGSQKQGSNRPKIFYEQFLYKGVLYKHQYNEDVTDINIKKLTIISESLVSFTSGCFPIPNIIVHTPANYNNLGDLNDLDECYVSTCLRMLKENMSPCPFSIKEVRGHYIILKRNRPSYCPICDRIHETENPYLFVVNNKVYWDCRRHDKYQKNKFLGFLSISLEQNTEENKDEIEEEVEEFNFGGFNLGAPTLPVEKKQEEKPREKKPVQELKTPQITHITNIKNVPNATMSVAQQWALNKYLKREANDFSGSLSSVSSHINWSTGVKY